MRKIYLVASITTGCSYHLMIYDLRQTLRVLQLRTLLHIFDACGGSWFTVNLDHRTLQSTDALEGKLRDPQAV